MNTPPISALGADDPEAPVARNARLEAQQVLREGFDARVLEPSPPAVTDGEWFADDPVARGDVLIGRRVVSPVASGDLTWDEWLADRPERASWAAARWLGAYRRLKRPPATLPETRLALHRLAVYVISPARRRANGKIALRWTFGGMGTPFFGADEQVRVAGAQLIRQRSDDAVAESITTLDRAAAFVLGGPPDLAWAEPFDVPPPGDPDEELKVDPEAAAFLGDWYGFAHSVLEALRADPASVEASRVQLWPEHFDAAFECLPDDQYRRAGFGASPGDAAVDEPYLYVAPWHFDEAPSSELWNAESFRGAILPLSELVDEADQRTAALAFFRQRRALLEP
jgi:hypothetical protein